MNKKKIINISVFFSLFLALAITFFFCDLDISKVLARDNPNFIYVLLAAIGEFPIYIGPILFGLVYGFTNEKKITKLFSHFIGFVATCVALIRLCGGIFEEFINSNLNNLQYTLLIVASLLIYIILFMIVNKIDEEKLSKLRDIALLYLVVSVSSFLLITSMKFIWGRPRFRSLSSDYHEYTNFLTINGISSGLIGDEYHSFPSGHTNAATSILILGLIPKKFNFKTWIRYLFNGLCLGYVILVAVSRIGVGAHYASDVLFGFGVSLSCFYTAYSIFKKKGWLIC